MCGFAGIVAHEPVPVLAARLDEAGHLLAGRGPDGKGCLIMSLADSASGPAACADASTMPVIPPDHGCGGVPSVALVHRRLAIIDLQHGHQPFVRPALLKPKLIETTRHPEHDGLIIVFNGCIYNHRELRASLQREHQIEFISDHSDTETLLAAFQVWREDVLERLEGMFAFAVWDPTHRELFLARDRTGEKPLYAATIPPPDAIKDRGDGNVASPGMAFASTIPALRALLGDLSAPTPDDDGDVDERPPVMQLTQIDVGTLLAGLIEGFLPTGGTPYVNLREVYPGTYERFRVVGGAPASASTRSCDRPALLVGAEQHRYWANAHARRTGGTKPRSVTHAQHGSDDATRELTPDSTERLLRSAVAARLDADVPLGCFLSGGVDSSLIAAFARDALQMISADSLKTFCVRMPDPRFDESAYAREVAAHLRTEHRTLDISPQPADDLVFLIRTLGMPFGDSSLLPTYWVSRAAREHVKVALSGDGGDELFLGYERTLAAGWLARHHRWLRWLPGAQTLQRVGDPKSRRHKAGRLLAAPHGGGYAELRRVFPSPWRERILTDAGRHLLDAHAELTAGPGTGTETVPASRPSASERARLAMASALADDFDVYLPGDLLRKVDTASMAVGLEVRCPMLDRTLVEAALTTPVDRLLLNGERKGLLRAVARRHLPASVVDRPKMGFGIPIGAWFRTDYGGLGQLLGDLVVGSAEPFGGLPIDVAAVRRLWRDHIDGRMDHGQRLFGLLTLAIWCREEARGPVRGNRGTREPASPGAV